MDLSRFPQSGKYITCFGAGGQAAVKIQDRAILYFLHPHRGHIAILPAGKKEYLLEAIHYAKYPLTNKNSPPILHPPKAMPECARQSLANSVG
jgi:hypothetical protein